ncbi:MAG: rhodanese-like domain-containing protein [Myxococcales bacterium]
MQTISRDDLKTLIDSRTPHVLLEALPEKYYREGHLPGALQLDYQETRNLAPCLAPNRAVPIVVYCASDTCRNSHTAAALLQQLGYQSVHVYQGGKADWSDAGLHLER